MSAIANDKLEEALVSIQISPLTVETTAAAARDPHGRKTLTDAHAAYEQKNWARAGYSRRATLTVVLKFGPPLSA